MICGIRRGGCAGELVATSAAVNMGRLTGNAVWASAGAKG
jgi:hypothetical protein